MVGANYMGGKRNYVRSKGKDRETRLQKSYFGKQRLQLLSKGLSSRNTYVEGTRRDFGGPSSRASASIANISLAHARQKIPPDSMGNSSTSRGVSWIQEPEYVPGSTFGSGSSPLSAVARIRNAHTPSSTTKTKASILQKLDTTEPFCLKQLLERIRTTPDLAGLSRKGVAKESSTSLNIAVLEKMNRSKVREREVLPDERATSQGGFNFGMQGEDEHFGEPAPYASSDDGRYAKGSSPVIRSPASSPYHISNTGFGDGATEDDFNFPTFSSMEVPDSSIAYDDETRYFDAHQSVTAPSSSSRPFQLLSSPPTSVDKPAKGLIIKSTPGPNQCTQRSSGWNTVVVGSPSMSLRHPQEQSEAGVFDERGLPSVIRLPKPTDRAVDRRGSVYGSLFRYPDPWSVIGEILSQGDPGYDPGPKDQRGQRDGDMRNRDSESTRSFGEEADDASKDDESALERSEEDRPFEELEFEDDENDQGPGLRVEPDVKLDEYEDWDAVLGLYNTYEQGDDPYRKLELGELQFAVRNEFQGANLGSDLGVFKEDQVVRRYSPPPIFEPASEDNDKHFRQHTGVDNTHKSPCQSIGTLPTVDLQLFHCSPIPAQCGGKRIESGPGGARTHAEGSPQASGTLDLWEAPELEERNGKFVGPSLFDDDGDDDDF